MAIKDDHSTYRVAGSADDDEYGGLCTKFPGLSGLAKTPEGALKGIRNVVENVIQDMRDNKEEVPEPIAIKINLWEIQYENNINFLFSRMPGGISEQHRFMAVWILRYYVLIWCFNCPIIIGKLALSKNCMGRYLGAAFYSATIKLKVAAKRHHT